MSNPKVSIVLAVKNEEKFIHKCIDSLINQNYDNKEIIFVDDNSTDKTLSILNSYKNKYSFIKIFKNHNFGKVSAFNLGVSESTGDWICLFAGDDIMPKDSLNNRVEKVLNEDFSKKLVVGVSKIRTISDEKKYNGTLIPKKKGVGLFSGQCYLMHKNFIKIAFPIPKLLPNEDTWLTIFLKYSNKIKLIHNDVICCMYRIHDKNSMRKDLSFNEYSLKINQRSAALDQVIALKEDHFSTKNIKYIKELIKLEKFRFKNQFYNIIFLSLRFEDKLRAIINSNKFSFYFKNLLFKFFVGR